MIGLGIVGFLGYNQFKLVIEKSVELKVEIKIVEVKIVQKKK